VDETVIKDAIKFVKSHKNEIKQEFAGDDVCGSEKDPISIFMAGSPGAGKTEFSKRFLKKSGVSAVRIDADEVREVIPQYNGRNSDLVQRASALAVEYIYDHVLDKKKNMIFDATFADYEKSYNNVERSLRKGRHVEIYYLYQDPMVAWRFTKIREAVEGRFVPKEVFVRSFIDARKNVNMVKEKFGSKVQLHVIVKNFNNNLETFRLNVSSVDGYINLSYTYESLMEKL